MKKNQVELKRYLAPKYEVIRLDNESALLLGSEIKPTPGVGNPPIEVGDNDEDEEELEFD
ncbi:hypothetical protein [Hoylesella enoeca]|uniref:Uncharacterized protein n=1 Tax=Hoylesella enoeca TaxID=76123 RepID=A0A0S2KLM1_9BACT|nr:hypothetical protein [Hoylesella enoeca]ALO49193.1 hypothetical protein AS203_08935 [Hoylesella enoeca]